MIQDIHITKTGGAALAQAYAVSDIIKRNEHSFRLSMLEPGDDAITIVRDPVARFVSAFNWIARYRRDTSPVPWPWTTAEQMALGIGSHGVDSLLVELQVFLPQRHWLDGDLSRLIWVGHTETLRADFLRLCDITGLPRLPGLPPPGPASNTGPPHAPLSEQAQANIRDWYADDYGLIKSLPD